MTGKMLYRCGCQGTTLAHDRAGERSDAVTRAKGRTKSIDVHCHLHTPAVEKFLSGQPGFAEAQKSAQASMGEETARLSGKMVNDIWPKLTTAEERLADMDRAGIDIQVLSPSPAQYYYWAGREQAEQIVKLCNENIAAVCAKDPDRFRGLGNASLQHPDLACTQLEYAVKTLGFSGVEISSSVHGTDLHDPRLDPFWAKAEELDAVVFIHPMGSSLGPRVIPYFLSNTIGQPLETTIALSNLIFSGTLDRHSALKILAAHGGGYLPLYSGRSDHAHHVRPEAMQCKHAPSYYLQRMWHDTVVYHPQALAHLINAVGTSQVVLGTDYPFDMAESDPLSLLSAIENLDEDDCAAILGGNAAKLMGLSGL